MTDIPSPFQYSILIPALFLLANLLWAVCALALEKSSIQVLEELEEKSTSKNPRYELALSYRRKPDEPFALLEASKTLSTLLFGWFASLVLYENFQARLALEPLSISLTAIVLITIHFLFTDVLARIVTNKHPERTLITLTWALSFLEASLAPLMKIFRLVVGAPLRPFGIKLFTNRLPTEDDLKVIVEGGGFEQDQVNLIGKALDFSNKNVRTIMVPRHQIAFISMNRGLKENLQVARKYGHTRFPLVEADLDSVLNYVHIKDFLWVVNNLTDPQLEEEKDSLKLKKVAREILYVPESKPIDELLKEFQLNKAHLAMVIDEYGGVTGLVTLEDILEELVGEIQDEFDKELPKVQNIGENTYLIDGTALLDEVQELLDVQFKDKEDDTIGGYVLTQLGRIAQKGDIVENEEFRIKVVKVYRKRVAQVKLTVNTTQDDDRSDDLKSEENAKALLSSQNGGPGTITHRTLSFKDQAFSFFKTIAFTLFG